MRQHLYSAAAMTMAAVRSTIGSHRLPFLYLILGHYSVRPDSG